MTKQTTTSAALATLPFPSGEAKEKIFVIGYPKTGTTSSKVALRRMGVRVCGVVGGRGTIRQHAMSYLPKYDAFQNFPWSFLYQDLDAACPGSKFILTTRDEDSWISSMVRNFGYEGDNQLRKCVFGYGNPRGHEEIYLQTFRRHYAEVREYFADRPNDFMEMCLFEGEGWEKLCPFLGLEEPRSAFPHANRRPIKRLIRAFRQRRAA